MTKEREQRMMIAAKILAGTPINELSEKEREVMMEHGTIVGSFICGVLWADQHPENPWVHVNERKPEDSLPTVNDEEYGRKCIRVMVLMKSGNIMSTTRMYSNGTWYFNLPLRMRDDIVYWMPVFPVPNE